MKIPAILLMVISTNIVIGRVTLFERDKEERRIQFIVDLISFNLKSNGWSNIINVGHEIPDVFYMKMKQLALTSTIMHPAHADIDIYDVVPYYSNVIVLHCKNFDGFEEAMRKVITSPYWHPHSNIILYYHVKEKQDISKIFFIFWFYRACNAIVLQYDDAEENLQISYYNPYISENYKLSYTHGCWKTSKIGRAVRKFRDSFTCVAGCHNITLHSKLRNDHIGTCIGVGIQKFNYGDTRALKNINLFEDKGKNLHGYVLKGLATEVLPFMEILDLGNGSFNPRGRDGMIWTVASEVMNFGIDLSASKNIIKEPFHFETNILQISSFARRQADIVIFPIYQFDIIIVEIDLSIAYKDSGVCIMSHRAGFETVLFDVKLLEDNTHMAIRFLCMFVLIWLLFFIFNSVEVANLSFDQAGKALVNTIRSILSISLHKPPKRNSFRIYLGISMWCFFVVNFATQAAIISFFSAYKRGKDVETFEDVIEKAYVLEGMASPDMILPETEERFRKINEKLVSLNNLFECVYRMKNDSRRFCLIDCSVGRYLERNWLNEKGEQYLHIARDRIHSHYLNMVLHKYSPMTNTFNRYLRIFFETGLINKWEENRFSEMKAEAPIKALTLEDLIGIFKCHYLLMGLSSFVFIIEILTGIIMQIKQHLKKKIAKWRRIRVAKVKLIAEKKLGQVKMVNAFTQTKQVA